MKLSSPDTFSSCRLTLASTHAGWTACECLVPGRASVPRGVLACSYSGEIHELNAIFQSTLHKDFELPNFLLRCFLPDRCLSKTHPTLSQVSRKVSRHRARPQQHTSTSFKFSWSKLHTHFHPPPSCILQTPITQSWIKKFHLSALPLDPPPLAFETSIGTPLSTKYQKFLIYFESNAKGYLYY